MYTIVAMYMYNYAPHIVIEQSTCDSKFLNIMFITVYVSLSYFAQCRSGGQEEVEADAEAEIREIVQQKEELEKKRAAAKAEQDRLAREREEAGASWGMGKKESVLVHVVNTNFCTIDCYALLHKNSL